eukprot:TRINITY_DN12791_c0_g1_i1.p1 TRINITY_DN12791_c0_g1~~TRINITY_DN12791_c0_g1_i1.p1  ORF type:complete len:171 (-),score=22.33 TRINITY_DN12791_c0_g1_i1:22-534(-)
MFTIRQLFATSAICAQFMARGFKASTKRVPVGLLRDVSGLGKAGEVALVKPGYASNFLTRGPDHPCVYIHAENKDKFIAQAAKTAKSPAEINAKRLMDSTLMMKRDEKNLGTWTVDRTMIVDKLLQHLKVSVNPADVQLEQPITTYGEFEVPVRLSDTLTSTLKLTVAKR